MMLVRIPTHIIYVYMYIYIYVYIYIYICICICIYDIHLHDAPPLAAPDARPAGPFLPLRWTSVVAAAGARFLSGQAGFGWVIEIQHVEELW